MSTATTTATTTLGTSTFLGLGSATWAIALAAAVGLIGGLGCGGCGRWSSLSRSGNTHLGAGFQRGLGVRGQFGIGLLLGAAGTTLFFGSRGIRHKINQTSSSF